MDAGCLEPGWTEAGRAEAAEWSLQAASGAIHELAATATSQAIERVRARCPAAALAVGCGMETRKVASLKAVTGVGRPLGNGPAGRSRCHTRRLPVASQPQVASADAALARTRRDGPVQLTRSCVLSTLAPPSLGAVRSFLIVETPVQLLPACRLILRASIRGPAWAGWLCAALVTSSPAIGGPPDPGKPRRAQPPPAARPQTVVTSRYTSVGNIGLALTNLGYFGNLLNPSSTWPSCEYPLHSHVEHMFVGGLWVGGIDSEGRTLVSAGAEDTPSGSNAPHQEFGPRPQDTMQLISSNPLSPQFALDALADQQFIIRFDDYDAPTPGDDPLNPHVPLGVEVNVNALAYAPGYADDFVILKFDVVNISGREITDLFMAWYSELTVGNTTITIPGSDSSPWTFQDDYKSFIGPATISGDPDIHLMYARDDDGERGLAPSWVGVRLLGTNEPYSIFSYRQWPYRTQYPQFDPDKYAFMASGAIDVGQKEGPQGQIIDFTVPRNWIQMMGFGPWHRFDPGDTASFTVAVVCGLDSLLMLQNSQVAQTTFNQGFKLASGPPSPLLGVSTADNAVILRWKPGVDTPPESYDPVLASPEYHRNQFTLDHDFQGYRIYRLQAASISGDPREQASLLAQFDVVDSVGFNVGMPPLNAGGEREYVDTDVLNGFPYYYAVTSYASRNPQLGLPELESGFNENSLKITPGSAPGGTPQSPPVGVYPNPYRAAGLFDRRLPGGEPAELGRTVYFTNVPADARIEVFNLSGTLIDQLERHETSTGQVAWDMLSEHTRAIAPGLYVFVVEDLRTGERQRGKLVILK